MKYVITITSYFIIFTEVIYVAKGKKFVKNWLGIKRVINYCQSHIKILKLHIKRNVENIKVVK